MAKLILIEDITIDANTQSRAGLSSDAVDDYTDVLDAAKPSEWPFPPLDVFSDGSSYYVADGFHRLMAAIRVKRTHVMCNVHRGTAHDARIFSMTANDKHGLRMTREEKRECVRWLLERKTPRRETAELAGVSRRTVDNVANDMARAAAAKERKQQAKEEAAAQKETAKPSSRTKQVPSTNGGTTQLADPPKEPAKAEPRPQYERDAWFSKWTSTIGPVARLVDRIADSVDDNGSPMHRQVQRLLDEATQAMRDWLC